MENFTKVLLTLHILSFYNFKSQVKKEMTYSDMTYLVGHYHENDERPLAYVYIYIAKAKKEQKFFKIIAVMKKLNITVIQLLKN